MNLASFIFRTIEREQSLEIEMLMRFLVLLLKRQSQNRTCYESENFDVRRIRQCRAELRKFMRDVKKGNPAATVIPPHLTIPILSKSFPR